MRLSEITPRGFRNLSPEPVAIGTGITLIAGENGQGKTNLLEAIALLCGQRSFRKAKPWQMAADGESFSIDGILRRGFETERLRVDWSRGIGRSFRRGEKEASFPEVSSLAPAVFLAPEHRELVTGPPSARRRFLDRLVLGSSPVAAAELLRYERALAERNALLAAIRDKSSSGREAELEAWTEELIRAGTAVRRRRSDALGQWQELFRELAAQAGRQYAEIRLEYAAGGEREEQFRQALERLASLERHRGYSIAGPHRDEIHWTRLGRSFAEQASAGEVHRSVSLAKLAEWRAVWKAARELPLLAVDDFDAGLSPSWVEEFWNALPEGAPVLLTTASDPSVWRRRAAAVVEMQGGRAGPLGTRRAVSV